MTSRNTFFADENYKISYAEFLSHLRKKPRYRRFCKAESVFEYFSQIVLALLDDGEITLLDADLTENEIKNLVGSEVDIDAEKSVTEIPQIENFNDKLNSVKKFSLTLYTSGTTGRPKKITHTFKSLSRFAKVGNSHKDDIWAFAYNPSHIAGIQVFFQALLNNNTIVNLFGKSKEQILSLLKKNQVTHISATPTFYRILLPCTEEIVSVKRLTSGGEKFDKTTIDKLSSIFPNAKTTNVYASTEAGTLFASNGDYFTVKSDMENFVKIENSELLIHNSLLGKTENSTDTSSWYNTGDLVEVVAENPLRFRFVSRKTSLINTGGYKVNPEEVEDAIREINGIGNVRVFGKKSSILGNIVCAEIELKQSGIDERMIKTELKKKLQDFKIPRIINFIDNIPQTRTGKIDRTL